MNKTKDFKKAVSELITINTDTLQALLNCGRASAINIGISAHAKIHIGGRVLWNLKKVQDYIDSISE